MPLAALTAWGAVVDVAKAHEGQRILIHAGAGGVGHFAVQFATFFGAHVIATGSTRNVRWLRELGAREVIDYTTTRFEDAVSDVDVVIDLVGNAHDDTGTRSLPVLRPVGLIVNGAHRHLADLRRGGRGRGSPRLDLPRRGRRTALAVISRLLESGDVRVFVDQRLPDSPDRAAAAHPP